MSSPSPGLIPGLTENDPRTRPSGRGLLPSQAIEALVRAGEIGADPAIAKDQIQPASIDLRLGPLAHRVTASFLPGADCTVAEKLARFSQYEIDLTHGAVLERGCVYVVPVLEHLRLSERIAGVANPKSSIGRIDLFTRLIADRSGEFDRVEEGYKGPLYVEIAPRSFSVRVATGLRLNQLRFRRGSRSVVEAGALRHLQREERLVGGKRHGRRDNWTALSLSVDLIGTPQSRLVGFKAKAHAGLIDVAKVNYYDPIDYWEPILPRDASGIILNPGDFYVLCSKEPVAIPPNLAAELVAYDTLVGEFRVHYAGFFDPGFGYAAEGGGATRAVLEVRSHDVPFVLEDGQVIGRLVYEELADKPDRLYGVTIGSSYQRQGLQLSKHFRPYAP